MYPKLPTACNTPLARWRKPGAGAARGDGRRAELSERAGQKTAGVSQGGDNPLGCDLCLLSVASQKVGAPAARAGERKEIDSPREGRVCESKPVVVQPVNCGPLGRSGRRLPAREARHFLHRSCDGCRSPAGGGPPFLVRQGAARHSKAGIFSAGWPVRHPLGVPGGNATENRAHRAFCWPFGRESRS